MEFETLIDAAALAALPERANLVILDCRFDLAAPQAGRSAFLAGHLPGARYADLERDLSAAVTASSGRHPLPDPADLARAFRALGIGATTQVVVYDEANGAFAARAWWLLRWLGHRRVAVLDGGLRAYLAGGGVLETGAAPAAPAAAVRFTARLDTGAALDTAQLIEALRDPRRLLIDARAPERYAGSVEPIDPVAGHVPGARNHPFAENLAPDGRFLPAAELRTRWQQRLAGCPAEQVIVMCGSGVTACHNLLALQVAGFAGARLYAGSWSEWIRDPARPVARGPNP